MKKKENKNGIQRKIVIEENGKKKAKTIFFCGIICTGNVETVAKDIATILSKIVWHSTTLAMCLYLVLRISTNFMIGW